MRDDKQLIRDLIATWQRATAAGDLPQLLSLMAEDVVFLLPREKGTGTFSGLCARLFP